jgi:FMN phosphatase YigB (HAD superfamily)
MVSTDKNKKIKHILFDLGGVLLNLDMNRTWQALQAFVSEEEYHKKWNAWVEDQVFEDYEKGNLSEADFLSRLSQDLGQEEVKIAEAWSLMLLDFPSARYQLLADLKESGYRLYLLSNINSIHLRDVRKNFEREHQRWFLESYFEKIYYSHLIGRRKPDKSTFEFVLQDAKIKASETLFIDDNAENIKAAEYCGYHVIHHPANTDLYKSLTTQIEWHEKNS